MNMNEIGNRIKMCRKQQNMTQEELAEKMDVSAHYIYEIERGSKNMSLPVLCKVANTLDISTDYILFGTKASDTVCKDHLQILVESVPVNKRDHLVSIIQAILPHMK